MIFTTISMVTFLFAPANYAALVHFQAGDIAMGQAVEIERNGGPASYYKDGKTGNISFVCSLNSQETNVVAMVVPGKNFNPEMPIIIKSGLNGPYEWALRDNGESNGNIKVSLIEGQKATVQCKQVG